jgi:hypothetical protein
MKIPTRTILKLKKTATPQFPGPMGWREIGRRLGMSGPGARFHAEKILADNQHPRCPSCLQELELEKTKNAGSVTGNRAPAPRVNEVTVEPTGKISNEAI